MSGQGLKPYNRPINHIAISCSDLTALVAYYTELLGFQLIGEIRHFKRSEDQTPFEAIFVSYPSTLQELKFAILATGNGVGIECFEFIDPTIKPREEAFEFTRPGFFHICITDPNPEVLVENIKQRGGRTLGQWMDYSRYGLEEHRGIYTQDPWGNVVEIMSLTLERVASAGEAMATLLKVQAKM
ncbi:glyoxalase/bleomycin resistance family protein [Talaromyces stipitatus ATCC 10500]|uniref:Glyoxalase/bleomycin resistance family protein n=1 Tax=Talaromyces stipitatus (strain ATCC 10500 / CBS 375.48 / QM 6759 / NRRL 1006) TaxID=441959 RepID=B8MDX2_TALSN|nr:glyoxalase/bleomycin resistance family protein [Talaromyces stipitatus ATCC 10500]EED16049.1 glyoxalase/bleomycin resistance family protein [Talaromyces stipitatus ATCC 10500]